MGSLNDGFDILWKLSPQRVYHFLIEPKQRKKIKREINRISGMPRYKKGEAFFYGKQILFNDQASFLYQFNEIFTKENYLFQTDIENPLIYDCGANIGLSVIYFKMLFPKSTIKAFEPDPEIAYLLNENVRRNSLNNVIVENKAIWKDNCRLLFGMDGSDGGSIYKSGNSVSVDAVRLKECIEVENKIALVKIDVEGAEVDILEDCKNSLHNVDKLFIEYHSFKEKKQNLSDILNILSNAGFRYYLQPISDCRHPFIMTVSQNIMDFQINIYAVKK